MTHKGEDLRQPRSIEDTILCSLYEAYFFDDAAVQVPGMLEEEGWDIDVTWKEVDRMVHDGLARSEHTIGGFYRITYVGILDAEERSVGPKSLIQENKRARESILDILATFYEEEGPLAHAGLDWLCEQTGLELTTAERNLRVLGDLGHVDLVTQDRVRITHPGMDVVGKQRQWLDITEGFERIAKMEPVPRGQGFQKWFARMVQHQGWPQEEGVRTSHEEIDVICFREREYYLVECKWEQKPVRSGVVRELYGKLENRVGVRGILVSMSGFTRGEQKQVREYANLRIILLFGSGDVHSIVCGEARFNELLNAKFYELVARRKAVFH